MLNRRSLLLGALAAPAIVRVESLMRIWRVDKGAALAALARHFKIEKRGAAGRA